MSTFVSVGNATQPFERLLRAIPPLVAELPQPVIVQYGNNAFRCATCEANPFVTMERFGHYIASSRLLILHAGAGSVIHALEAGKVPVVVPRKRSHDEIVDDHQFELAHALAAVGKVVLCEDVADLKGAAAKAMAMQERLSRSPPVPALIGALAGELSRYASEERGE